MNKTKINEIKYVYHISDLHIRNVQRHKEYRHVLTKFLKNVKRDNLKNAIIYIGGDIAHTKTEMSPELIREISWFFTECANLLPTFIITGNHDCNLNNSHRLDALTPIIENINHKNIHYLRDTEVYKYENITFVSYSIMDHRDNWPSGYDVEGTDKICLFHGPVNKSQSDIGYTIASESFTVDMFDGFHMAMLGDIHKRQTLQEYNETHLEVDTEDIQMYLANGWKQSEKDSNKVYKVQPAVVYCGSAIQQNHGELLENHGYLLWDVKSRTYESHDIHNDYGFVTIDVVKGVIPQWVYDEVDTKLPKYPRLRVRFNDTEPSVMQSCITILQKLFKVRELTVTRTDTLSSLKLNNELNTNIVGDVSDLDFQTELIRDYLQRQFLLDNAELDKISVINNEINSVIKVPNNTTNIIWKPIKFEFSNMFSYGENNKIEFDNANGIIGIFASNSSGKCVNPNTEIEIQYDEQYILDKLGFIPDELKNN